MINLVQLARGKTATPISAATATTTSVAQAARGHNAIIVYPTFSGSGAWTVKIQGSPTAQGTYADMYDNNSNLMSTGSISTNRCQLFVGIPEHFKIVATEDSGTATITVNYELLTI